jgi:hypothetical protein
MSLNFSTSISRRQTSPNKFDLNLLIHKTLTADSAKPPEKRPPTLPLHPLTISFDEKKGFLSYDVTLLPEVCNQFYYCKLQTFLVKYLYS